MSTVDELALLYGQWRSLTEEEGAAIQSGAWEQVGHFQAAKLRLQPRITELSQRLDQRTHEREFRFVVDELIQLERRNDGWLHDRRRETQRQLEDLDKTSRNLRQLHKSYVPPARAHWQSYS
jgi:hypothetical protein